MQLLVANICSMNEHVTEKGKVTFEMKLNTTEYQPHYLIDKHWEQINTVVDN